MQLDGQKVMIVLAKLRHLHRIMKLTFSNEFLVNNNNGSKNNMHTILINILVYYIIYTNLIYTFCKFCIVCSKSSAILWKNVNIDVLINSGQFFSRDLNKIKSSIFNNNNFLL